MRRGLLLAAVASAALAGSAWGQEGEPEAAAGPEFRWGGEVKVNYRHSDFLEFRLAFPFPPEFIPEGEDAVYMRTPDPGSALELQNVSVFAEAEWTPSLKARVVVNFVDLYNRNPTSSAERVFVREAWLLAGTRYDVLQPQEGTRLYLLVGKAHRFSKQLDRRLESYGLWGTAVGRFEQVQVTLGGSLGKHVYWRATAANPNPLFMRDTNVLAGDFGTPEMEPGHVDPIYGSGFPILYDTMAQDWDLSGEIEGGAGLGLRFMDGEGRNGLDLLGWYFKRDLEDAARIHGTFYEGDLDMLRGAGIPLPYSGREKEERGVNLQARLGGLRLFGQYVWQTIAGLDREGYEVEAAYRFRLPGLFASGDTPVINWIQPAVRYSVIDDKFFGPRTFVAPSFFWDWNKLDVGVRVGIIRQIEVTLEYSFHDMYLRNTVLHPDESLATVRFTF